ERVREQQRESLARQNANLHETATLLAAGVKARPPGEWQSVLDQFSATGQLTAIEIVSENGEVVAHSEATIPEAQREELKTILRSGRESTVESIADGKGFDLTAVPLTNGARLLFVPQRLSDTDVNDTIAGSQREYQHLLQRQRKVRLLGVSTLGLMTLLLLFASPWVGIHPPG